MTVEKTRSLEEEAAASAVASLSAKDWKRVAVVDDDSAENARPSKKARASSIPHVIEEPPVVKESHSTKAKLLPPPFYYYKDYSGQPDDDPLAPLTPPGRVPNFPAKMHAILSRPDLADVVAWMPHGRSWRVLKPREFEIRVIPTYFEHSKFSSFIRQANGWGFRRITQGRDRNSYYHEMFLRGLPHLCKKMKRPGVSEKAAADAEHEPDFYKISEMSPVPEKAADDESIMLRCTLQGGPKARMPVYTGPVRLSKTPYENDVKPPSEQTAAASLHRPTRTPESLVGTHSSPLNKPSGPMLPQSYGTLPSIPVHPPASLSECLTAEERLALAAVQRPQLRRAAALLQASSQFAAGFAAATALNSNHMHSVLGQALGVSTESSPVRAPTGVSSFGDALGNSLQQFL